MVSVAKLFWIFQLSVVLCLIRAQEWPMLGGAVNRDHFARFMNGAESEDDMDKNAYMNLDADMGRRLRRSQGSDTQGRLMDGDPIAASNMGIPVADPNMINTCQVVQNPGQQAIAPPAFASFSAFQGAPMQASQSQQPLQQGAQQLGAQGDRFCDPFPNAYAEEDESEQRRQDLRNLVQHLYVAQARVQLEATEIRKAQALASSAQAQLEESANQVRTVTASLHTAQQEVAASAIRAQIAQLQLAAHDQLLFAARQDVDALSSQMVGLQAAEGIVQPKLTVDLHALLDKLKQPLQQNDHPTPVPGIVASIPGMVSHQTQMQQQQAQGQGQGQVQAQGKAQGQVQGQAQGQGQNQNPRQSRMPDSSRNKASVDMSGANMYTNLRYN